MEWPAEPFRSKFSVGSIAFSAICVMLQFSHKNAKASTALHQYSSLQLALSSLFHLLQTGATIVFNFALLANFLA